MSLATPPRCPLYLLYPGNLNRLFLCLQTFKNLTFCYTLSDSVSKYAPPPLHLRQSLQRQYISSEASEQDLFSRVQRKLAGRKTSEVRLVRFM